MTKTDDVLAQVPPDKLADILAKLEAEKAARAAASPGAPTAVERAFVEVADKHHQRPACAPPGEAETAQVQAPSRSSTDAHAFHHPDLEARGR